MIFPWCSCSFLGRARGHPGGGRWQRCLPPKQNKTKKNLMQPRFRNLALISHLLHSVAIGLPFPERAKGLVVCIVSHTSRSIGRARVNFPPISFRFVENTMEPFLFVIIVDLYILFIYLTFDSFFFLLFIFQVGISSHLQQVEDGC